MMIWQQGRASSLNLKLKPKAQEGETFKIQEVITIDLDVLAQGQIHLQDEQDTKAEEAVPVTAAAHPDYKGTETMAARMMACRFRLAPFTEAK